MTKVKVVVMVNFNASRFASLQRAVPRYAWQVNGWETTETLSLRLAL